MRIRKKCPFTGEWKTRDLDVTQEQLDRYAMRTVLLQDAFPLLNAEEREFIKTGIDGEAWNKYVGGEDE